MLRTAEGTAYCIHVHTFFLFNRGIKSCLVFFVYFQLLSKDFQLLLIKILHVSFFKTLACGGLDHESVQHYPSQVFEG